MKVPLYGKITTNPNRRIRNRSGGVVAYPVYHGRNPIIRLGYRFWFGRDVWGDIQQRRYFLDDLEEGREYLVRVTAHYSRVASEDGKAGTGKATTEFLWTASEDDDQNDVVIPLEE